jgi:hypothetical protein
VTGTYEWNPMPHKVDVRCSNCRGLAIFEFAEVVKINLKKDVPFFQDSTLFEYHLLSDSCGHKWHGAFFFSGLHGSVQSITKLPDGYSPENWNHSKYLTRSYGFDLGSVSCQTCCTNQMHALDWPNEAYYSIEYKNSQLWAFNRESANDLYSFIIGSERKVSDFTWRGFLLHIPTVFKTKKAREPVAKKLNKLLSC